MNCKSVLQIIIKIALEFLWMSQCCDLSLTLVNLSSGKDSHSLPITNYCLEILEIIENLCSSFEEH